MADGDDLLRFSGSEYPKLHPRDERDEILSRVTIDTDIDEETFERRVRKLKKRVNPDISSKSWGEQKRCEVDRGLLDGDETQDHKLPRIDALTTTLEEWLEFEDRHMPCVIENLMEAEGWAASQAWQPHRLLRRYGPKNFDIGSFNYTDMTMADFMRYALTNQDDSPLYIFDPYYASKYPKLLDDYRVPSFFPDDYHHYAGERDRPLYRWFLVGPERSGTGIHQDPGFTSAWNALLVGRKRWAFFPPHIKGKAVKPRKKDGDEGIDWFLNVFPRLRPHAEELGMIEYTQKAGETLFVPYDWWHVVLNTTFTVSVTQNYAGRKNMHRVWAYTKKHKPRFARRWYFQMPQELRDTLVVSDFDVAGAADGSDSTSVSTESSD